MKRLLLSLFVLAFYGSATTAQMEINGTTLYGNEWIDYDKTYWKVTVAGDGMYKLSMTELLAAGFPDDVPMDRIQVYHFGEEHPVHRSTDGVGSDDDYLLFYGERNRSRLDQYIYTDDIKIFNPEYSLVNDNSAYFITVADAPVTNKIDYTEANLTGNSLSPQPYYIHEEQMVWSDNFYKPTVNASQVQYSTMMGSEGFGSGVRSVNSFDFSTSSYVASGPSPQLSLTLGGNNNGHRLEISANGELKQIVESEAGKPWYSVLQAEVPLTSDDMQSNIDFSVTSTLSNDDRNRISVAKLTYPRAFDFEGLTAEVLLLPASNSLRYIELADIGAGADVYAYIVDSGQLILTATTSGGKGFLLAPSSADQEIYIYAEGEQKSIGTINNGRQYRDYSAEDHDYIIISNDKLYDDGNGGNPVQEYADYRATANGGSYDPIVVDADQLYDQFAYGVDHHWISVKNFNHFVAGQWTDIKSEFIIGKAREYQDYRTAEQVATIDNFFVPTFGNPGSDIMLVTGFDKIELLFPIGRLAATSADDVAAYLEKVVDYESYNFLPQSMSERLWLKRIIHLSGGRDLSQRQSIAASLGLFENVIETSSYGAEVISFYKTSGEIIENATSDQILNLINGGVSVITFLGHSSPGTFDFNLDNVVNYSNKGKYPIIFSLGCYAGNIHTSEKALSEQFVLEPEKGAVAFVASSGSAYLPTLRNFGIDCYHDMGDDIYGGSIGDIVSAAVDTMNGSINLQTTTFLQQIVIHGDPAITMIAFEGPDLVIDPASATTDPTFVDNYQESFKFCFEGVNLGSYTGDSLDISIKHQDPSGGTVTDSIVRVLMPAFKSEYCIELPLLSQNLIGQNRILVEIDASNEIDESPTAIGESNNVLINQDGVEGFDFFILSNSAEPIYPYKYSIVQESEVILSASTYNGLTNAQDYVVQLDTSGQFDSDFLKSFTVSGAVGLISQTVSLDMPAGTVYYWRVSPQVTNTEVGFVWNSSSFIYDPSLPVGFNQSHYYQLSENDYSQMSIDSTTRQFRFATNFRELRIISQFYVDLDFRGRGLINGAPWEETFDRRVSPAIGVTVFDSIARFVVNSAAGDFGSTNPYSGPIITYYFKMDNQQSRIDLVNFLENEIPEGHHVYLYPTLESKTDDWKIDEWAQDSEVNGGKSIFTFLEEQGAEQFDEFRSETEIKPYVVIFRKDRGVLVEDIATDQDDIVDAAYAMPGVWIRGSMKTPPVGPAAKWNNLVWDVDDSQFGSRDTVNVSVFGVNANGVEDLLIDSVEIRNIDLSFVDAAEYPFLSIRYYVTDRQRTPIHLNWWRVYYDPMPDLSMAASAESVFLDSIQQGAALKLPFEVTNVSAFDMQPTSISYQIISENNEVVNLQEDLPAIPGGSTVQVNLDQSSRDLLGKYQLRLEVNEAQSPMERFYFNNLGFTEFEVYSDKIDPVMDVTFDGVPILENDIVSGEPLIAISLKDENRYLLLTDTQNIELALQYPDGTVREVDVHSSEVVFTPANGEDNTARLEYTPDLVLDGTYKLEVNARDETNNTAGRSKYSVSFRVFNEEMVSNVFNYPNPFSTSTQFVFTLTGNEDPGNILIRIMTVTGKVVKEITMAELGNVHIGVNKTDYKWDGTDEYGDKLANGVYLYQVITKKLDGSDYQNFSDPTQNDTNWMFKEGFGKMVIMR